jgi:DUF1680 family protein
VRRESVAADRGRIALQRGPIVYAAEWPDNPQGHVRNLLLKDGDAARRGVSARLVERRRGDHGHRCRLRDASHPAGS